MKNEINILYITLSLMLAVAVAPNWTGSDRNGAEESRAKNSTSEQNDDQLLLARVKGSLSEDPGNILRDGSETVVKGEMGGFEHPAEHATTAGEIAGNVAELK